MSQSSIRNYSIFDIDIDQDNFKYAKFDGANSVDFENFLKRLARDTRVSTTTRTAIFKDDSHIKKFIEDYMEEIEDVDNNESKSAEKIAKRLFDSENENNNKGAAKIKKGSLVVCSIDFSGNNHILIFKIDFEKYFNRETFNKELGLPEDKGLLKSCIVDIDKDGKISDPILFDSNSTISKFWRYNFLESEFFKDDFENTKIAYDALTGSIIGLSRSSKSDYQSLKANLTSYFTSASHYDHEKMLDSVIRNYEPFDEKVKVEDIIQKFNDAKKKSKFDGNFAIDKTSIKHKITKSYNFDDGVELTATAGIQSLFRTVKDGQEYVLIKTKSAPKEFTPMDTD